MCIDRSVVPGGGEICSGDPAALPPAPPPPRARGGVIGDATSDATSECVLRLGENGGDWIPPAPPMDIVDIPCWSTFEPAVGAGVPSHGGGGHAAAKFCSNVCSKFWRGE
jgi:hypothetical protein